MVFYGGYSPFYASAGMDAAAANAKANTLDLKTGDLHRRVVYLEQWLDRMAIGIMAMSELLAERHGITEADIEAKVKEIDLRDGIVDGKITRQLSKCSSCSRENNGRRSQCLYCGATLALG